MPRFLILLSLCLAALVLSAMAWQRQLLYFPTHHKNSNGLVQWRSEGELIGFVRTVPQPANVWLVLHGNGGQASDRAYALSSFSNRDSVYILEYPGYGERPGTPSRRSLDQAAQQAYRLLRAQYPKTPVCVVGESLGSGPASVLASEHPPPDKIVLVTPFDKLHRVGQHHYPFLPVRLIISDDWDNAASLKAYQGAVEIFAAKSDQVIPAKFARALAQKRPGTVLHEIEGGHNDWATPGRVVFKNP